MYFETFNDFIHMNGHGGYVWFCYGVATLVLTAMFVQPISAKKKFLKQQRALIKRQQASK